MKYIDITPTISTATAVYPGDTPFKRKVEIDFASGKQVLSSIETTLHIGAHADAPSHYHPDGKAIDQQSLHYYMGACQVIDVSSGTIKVSDIEHYDIKTERVLFKTNSFVNKNQWHSEFSCLCTELINHLADQGVILLGIDTPSVDHADAEDLICHQTIYERDMAILEGLDLSQVDEGIYTLVALPLKIKDADASPVRAILLPILFSEWQENE